MTQAAAKHQQFDIGVKALIVQRGRVLLLKRRDVHRWELPGGRINEGENVQLALRRELAEELPGVKRPRVHEIVHAEQADFMLPSGNGLMLLCFRVDASLPETPPISPEHEAACWASLSKVQRMGLQSPFRHAAILALKK